MQPAQMTAAEVRELARTQHMTTTSGYAAGYMQANLLAVPQEYAFDFLLFAQRNPKSCPIVGVLEAGEYSSELLPGGDIRTDIPSYRIFKDGELVDSVEDAIAYWDDDMVGFLIGCSFTFETALVDNGIRLEHIEQGRNVAMYKTSIPCAPAGVFSGPMVVSMSAARAPGRGCRAHTLATLRCMARRHAGNPEDIGITDLSAPDFARQ